MKTPITFKMMDGNIAHFVFDRPGSSANFFDRETMEALNHRLDELTRAEAVSGLVLISAKPAIFVAGADINELLCPTITEEEVRALVRAGQNTFDRIAALPFPTVAAIHGASLGGGFELCLACNMRIASPDRCTRIGLPETSLGVIPAWGGSTRLPRLIGVPAALNLILSGRRLTSYQARKFGLVDQVVPREHFERIARRAIEKGGAKRKSLTWVNSPPVVQIARRKSRQHVREKSNGHYPALNRAIDLVARGARGSFQQSLAREADAFVDLVRTDACKNLVRIFFLQERAKKLRIVKSKGAPPRFERSAVIGAGVMGSAIAQWLAARDLSVTLKDIDEEKVRKGMANIGKLFHQAVKRRLFTPTEAERAMDRIFPTAVDVPLTRTELVIEAAVENMKIKQAIFQGLAKRASDDTILATNTSALSITELAKAVPKPGRVVGLHFFNPVHRMQLVEVIRGDRTPAKVVDRAVRFVQRIGKLPVVVRDRPGFVVNRILMPYLVEAGVLFEAGAPTDRIDRAMRAFGMPMGPLRLIDEVGADVAKHVADFLTEHMAPRVSTPKILHRLADAGRLGRKAGEGFYRYAGKREQVNDALDSARRSIDAADLGYEMLQRRMVLLLVNEAARCLEEQVAESPEDIDFAMIMGIGFAPFRGGPLRYADSLGLAEIRDRLLLLAEQVGPRYQPCDLIESMATNNQLFYP